MSGDKFYVKLDHGIPTVDQMICSLKAMPFELTYADANNQFLYYNNAHQDPDTMFTKRCHPQSGSRMSTVHGSFHQHVIWKCRMVIGTLRNVTKTMFGPLFQDLLKAWTTLTTTKLCTKWRWFLRWYQWDCLQLQTMVDRLQTTGQRLVGGSVHLPCWWTR